MPRLYREAPLMSIWEGSGNVAALDALRAMARQPETVEAFFKKAARKGRKFRANVAECAPMCFGHELAISLAEHGIPVTVISDSSIFTHLSRVTKVVLGAHSVMANGG